MDKTIKAVGLVLAALLLLIVAVIAIPGLSPFPPAPQERVVVYFFYGEECPHCHEVKPLILSLQEKYPDVEFQVLETWHNETNYKLSESLHKKLGVSSPGVPEVIIGDTVLVGSRDIPLRLEEEILKRTGGALTVPTTEVRGSGPVVTSTAPAIEAIYFYGDGCTHCAKVKPVIDDVKSRYPDLRLVELEVYYNATNGQKLVEMSQRLGIETAGVPIIFIGNSALLGEAQISEGFEPSVMVERERLASSTPTVQPTPVPGNASASPQLSLPMVIGAALIDSTNPCGLAVLVFLLLTMAAAGDRRRILLVGGVYTAAMFLFHLLVGVGLFSLFSFSGLAKTFSIIGGLIALLFGLITLIDVIRNRETFLLSISTSRKGLLGQYARKATLPAAFVLGILAGIFGFTCTGGIYISILGLMGTGMTMTDGLFWLILYNLVFVLPLVIVTLLVAYGLSPERAEKFQTTYKRQIRLLIGLILVALGVIILFGWFG